MTSLWKPPIGSDDICRFDVGVTWTRMADGFSRFVEKSPAWNILVPRDGLGHVVLKRGAATSSLQIKPSGSGDENGPGKTTARRVANNWCLA